MADTAEATARSAPPPQPNDQPVDLTQQSAARVLLTGVGRVTDVVGSASLFTSLLCVATIMLVWVVHFVLSVPDLLVSNRMSMSMAESESDFNPASMTTYGAFWLMAVISISMFLRRLGTFLGLPTTINRIESIMYRRDVNQAADDGAQSSDTSPARALLGLLSTVLQISSLVLTFFSVLLLLSFLASRALNFLMHMSTLLVSDFGSADIKPFDVSQVSSFGYIMLAVMSVVGTILRRFGSYVGNQNTIDRLERFLYMRNFGRVRDRARAHAD